VNIQFQIWVTKAERKFRRNTRRPSYHGTPFDTQIEFKGKTFMYKVVYGPLDNGQRCFGRSKVL